jgi:hypothetical protein
MIYHDDKAYIEILKKNMNVVQSELNCLEINYGNLQGNSVIKLELDKKSIGQTYKKDAQSVTALIESKSNDQEFLARLYEQKETIKFNGNDIDSKLYKLIRVPKTINNNISNIKSAIDRDIMVSIDHTYDDTIHYIYQIKRLHSSVQNIRKNMLLRPWNKITVILDEKYCSNDKIKNDLQESLTNATVMIGNYENDTDYKNNDMMKDTDNSRICAESFIWETFDNKSITGRLVVHYSKI